MIDKENDKRNIKDEIKGLDDDRIRLLYNEQALPFSICVVNLSGGLNTGIIMRTANFFGAKELFYVGRRHLDKRSAVGIYNYSTIKYLENYDILCQYKEHYRFVGVENNVPQAKPVGNYKYAPNSLLVFGEEGTGLDKEILDLCDDVIYIPRSNAGTCRSLNVSTAAGIIMADYISKM